MRKTKQSLRSTRVLVFAVCVLLCGCHAGTGGNPPKLPVGEDVDAAETAAEVTTQATATEEDAPSKPIIDRYGYEDGHSLLSFELKPGTAKDCGEYYQVDAVFAQAIEAPGDLETGDRVTLVFNELTGETKTLEYREDSLYVVDEGLYAAEYYYRKNADGSPVVLYQDSADRVDKPVFEGSLYVRKDAVKEIHIDGQISPVTLDMLNEEYNWYNGIVFDEKGYAVRLVFYGD